MKACALCKPLVIRAAMARKTWSAKRAECAISSGCHAGPWDAGARRPTSRRAPDSAAGRIFMERSARGKPTACAMRVVFSGECILSCPAIVPRRDLAPDRYKPSKHRTEVCTCLRGRGHPYVVTRLDGDHANPCLAQGLDHVLDILRVAVGRERQ